MGLPETRSPETSDEQVSLGQTFTDLASSQPDEVALVCEDTALTRSELESRANRLARRFVELGVRQDSLVTIGLPNGIDFVEATLATWKAGATPQPISSKLPGTELASILELAHPALTVGMEHDADTGAALEGTHPAVGEVSDAPLGLHAAASWKAPTSGGSTGTPKLIIDGRPAVAETTARLAELLRIKPTDTVLITGPLYHNAVFMTMATALTTGARVVVMPRFDAALALELVERQRVSWMYAVPTMMHRILRLPDGVKDGVDLSSLRTVYHFGAPCAPWLKRAWIGWFGPDAVWELYAGTEAQAATAIGGREWLSHEGSVGRPVSGEMKILDPDGAAVPPGHVGEVWMRPGEGRRSHYTYVGASPREIGGWESLGDMGHMDEDGYLYLADRDTDMILSGGANIYPAEVEAALDEHPAIMSSCVVGLPDDDLGNAVHAIVQLDRLVTDDEMREHLGGRLVRYKIPRTFERVEFPLRDDAGKVRRGTLRSERINQ